MEGAGGGNGESSDGEDSWMLPHSRGQTMPSRCIYYCELISSGIYKCKWRNRENDADSSSLPEKCWWWTLLLVFILGITWLFVWAVFSNDYNDFNWFVYENAEIWFAWGVLILVIFCIAAFYVTLILCSGIALIAQGHGKKLHLCHKITMIIICMLFIGAFIAVSKLWSEEYYSVVIALKMMAPWLHIALLFVITVSSWLMFYEVMRNEKFYVWLIGCCGVFILYLCACFVPLFIHSPCIGPELDSIPKPLLISHRLGAVMIAPENTILAFEQGDKYCDSFAVETDVSISLDGIPFLMHDTKNLRRTTNIETVFPDKADQFPEFFSWSELQQLDAGSWFLKQDPFLTVNSLSGAYKSEIRKQKIPTLGQIADKLKNYSIIFDLYRPEYGHPYYYNYTDVALDSLLNSGLPENQILWLPSYDRSQIANEAPGVRMVGTQSSIGYLKSSNISIVNLGYLEHDQSDIENYVSNNISVIQYVIQAPWLFSYAWCERTSFITTNNCEKMSKLSSPIWTLTENSYIAIWVSVDFFFLCVLVLIFFVQYSRSCCRFLPEFLDAKLRKYDIFNSTNAVFDMAGYE